MDNHPVSKKQQRISMFIFGALLICVNVIGLVAYYHTQSTYDRTEGVVVDFTVHSGVRSSGINPRIKFIVQNREYIRDAENSYFTKPFLKVGDRIKIFYVLSGPHNTVVIDSFMANLGVWIICGIIGLLCISIGRSIKINDVV